MSGSSDLQSVLATKHPLLVLGGYSSVDFVIQDGGVREPSDRSYVDTDIDLYQYHRDIKIS